MKNARISENRVHHAVFSLQDHDKPDIYVKGNNNETKTSEKGDELKSQIDMRWIVDHFFVFLSGNQRITDENVHFNNAS